MTHVTNGGSVATGPRYDVHEQWTKAGPVVSHLPAERVFELQEMAEASVGDPAPMGLFGFAVGTLLVAIPIAGIIPLENVSAALPTLLVFAGLAQFIAGMVAYRKGNTFAATAFCSFGANNVVVATFFLFRSIGVFGDTKNTMLLLGIDLICFGYIAFMLMVAATRVNAAFVLLLLALFPGYALAGINDVGAGKGFGEVGGWFLIIAAGLAFYCAGALVLNSTFNRTVLPMFSRA